MDISSAFLQRLSTPTVKMEKLIFDSYLDNALKLKIKLIKQKKKLLVLNKNYTHKNQYQLMRFHYHSSSDSRPLFDHP